MIKLFGLQELESQLEKWRSAGEKIVFTNGCFDVFHAGHVHVLCEAKKLGSKLIVGLNSDASVKKLKGETRPIHALKHRAMVISALEVVDAIVAFEDETPLSIIQHIQPDVLVKGGDYKPNEIVGASVVNTKQGKVVTIPLLEGFSSSLIIEKLLK